ncbi:MULTISPECIES: HAD-IB family hydrolase [unclassified Brevibacterium]|uniref:HAD-IB family hydrolase n=1 Tax=unclassified Brevibacterium TaxID=2614124 RepID=UPI001E402812|nr:MULTISPECIES: HAD-IB family hydrolase [unclassified Brevibacterium]MCD1287573.1 HAD-IB family hydrolase [Brevibacterium sp. CCUG 69071]MDK8436619.1 HAD-IB family hydrolase [Brevibacterium sp. H-BE7]
MQQSRYLLTGATGFLGQAVLQALLESDPHVRITALVRPRGDRSGHDRLQRLLGKPVFASWIDRVGEEAVHEAFDSRVTVLEGDLADLPPLTDRYDVVIHSASSVSFDAAIDEAFHTNVGGVERLYAALAESDQDPHVIHVSTAYVGGIAKGVVQESRLRHTVDHDDEFRAARLARESVEAESRQPEKLRRFIRMAQAQSSRMGPKSVAAGAEAAREKYVRDRLVEFGRTRAQSLGWTDIYTFTKALAERIGEEWAAEGHQVSFVRPSIIESAFRRPSPGWIDGFKVADPLIMAYAKGSLSEFPGHADSVLDIIPVDYVVNVILALAAHGSLEQQTGNPQSRPVLPAPGESSAEYYQVVSGTSNPLPFHQMVRTVREFFLAHPLPDSEGVPTVVPKWSFPSSELIEQRIRLKELATGVGREVVERLPASTRTRALASRLVKTDTKLKSLRQFADLYRQYTKTEMIFDDTNTRRLLARLPNGYPSHRGFDVTEIDWQDYFKDIHIPAITELTRSYSRDRRRRENQRTPTPLRSTSEVLAVFDLDGTVISANIVQQFVAVVRATRPLYRWPASMATMAGIVPGLLRAEFRDRSELIRMVNRRYQGFRLDELRAAVTGSFGQAIRDSIRPQARQLIDEHRAAGHRTVLLTGALDVLVEPIADLFDEVVATRMDVTDDGVLSGFLAQPPLVDEARANWLRKYADTVGADLARSTGYGDSLGDAAWLELVGNPVAVTPDLGLYGLALKKRWKVMEW